MKKNVILSAVFGLFCSAVLGQASLPSSENFNSFTGTFSQAGWTYVDAAGGTAPNYVYASGGISGTAAGRLDETMDYIEVFVGGQMGQTTYYLKGNNTGGAWQGNFNVLESVNGTAWSNLASYTTASPMATVLTQYTVTPSASARYLRWEFTSKTSGNNVAIDDVVITAGVPATQDINVKYSTSTILTGGTTPIFSSAVASPSVINFSVENLGLAGLNVSSVAISGAASGDYSVTSPVGPFAVGATSNTTLSITFTPSTSGSRLADLTINSDDPDEAAYVIHLYGVGGTLASEPASQPTNLNITGVKSYRAQYSFTAAAGSPEGYIVLRSTSSSPIVDVPVDGTWYERGDQIGASKVYYVGDVPSQVLWNVYANKQYQLAVFSYNGTGTYTNYNAVSPLTGSFTSSGSMMPGTEYSGITTAASTFITDLHNHVNPHTSYFYSNYTITNINLFEAMDTANGQKYVRCHYSDYIAVYTPPFDWTATDFSREHTFPHTWMPTYPADAPTEKPEYNDQHMLYPTKQTDVNDERSNLPLGEVITVQNTFMLGKSGLDANGHKVYEPKDSHKGDAARAIMYESICYTGVSGNTWNFPNPISATVQYGQDQEVLKAWHYQDPPDAYEIARNDFLDSLQGNRNPFIDSMQFACYIDFYTMTKLTSPSVPCGSFIGVKDNKTVEYDFNVFPNPSTGSFSILMNTPNVEVFTINVVDVTGRIVDTQVLNAKQGNNYVSFNKASLAAGTYMIEAVSSKDKLVKKLIVQ